MHELAVHQQQLRLFKAPQLFAQIKKINRTFKTAPKANPNDPSREEKAAERMSAPAVYGFIEVMVEAFDLEAFGLVYPLVETVLYMMSYLVQYPRCWPFILMVSQLFVANLESYVPLQQLLLTIVYHNSLPLPQSSLEVNPQ